MPAALKGALGMRGTYRLNGANSEITSELVLEDAKVGANPIAFQRSQVLLKDQASRWIWLSHPSHRLSR